MSDEATKQDDGIDLIELFAVLWRAKIMIIAITLVAAIAVVIYSIISIRLPPEESYLPNVYTASAYMLIDNISSGAGVSSMVGSSTMVNLASLIGVNVPINTSFSQFAIYLLGTNTLLDSVVDELDIINKYKLSGAESPRTAARDAIKNSIKGTYDDKNGVFSISFTHIDPVFARDAVNIITECLARRFDELGLDKNKITKENLELNITNTLQEILRLEGESRRLERSVVLGSSLGVPAITSELSRIDMELTAQRQIYAQLRVQYVLLNVEMASEKPVFQILEMAEVPEKKSGPVRGNMCIFVTLAAGFFAVFLAFVLNGLSNIRKDPEAMSKLRRKSEK